jgi:two-component system chemotaxis response regulator CheY
MDYSKAKVIVVDDNKLYLHLVKTVLKKRLDIDVVTVFNPKEMFAHLDKNHIDLIILDMELPVMDGLSALKLLRSKEKTRDIHVIPCTAIQKTELVVQLIKLGIDDFIIKSHDNNVIVEKVKKSLDKILI